MKEKAPEERIVLSCGLELILIDAENLSMKDRFMKYRPRTRNEVHAKHLIVRAIEENVKNFYRPEMDPSIENNRIVFMAGRKPGVGKSYNFWVEAAKRYYPMRNTRLGTKLEYGAFLGVLIKKLVKGGKSVKKAWNMVCNDSKGLGHYHNSKNGQYGLETTGSRCVLGFHDLINTYKILAKDEESGIFYLAGGSYECPGFYYTLASVRKNHGCSCDRKLKNAVGWVVFPQLTA